MKRAASVMLILAVFCLFTACGHPAQQSGPQPGQAPAAQSAPPTPVPTPYPANMLTGLPQGPDYPGDQRIAAVMVNNFEGCRPQRGLSEAKILFEIRVEGGISRFMGLYNSCGQVPEIGPLRSGRDQFFRLILPWQPVYVHIGESEIQSEYIRSYQYDEWNIEGLHDAYWRHDKTRLNLEGEHPAIEHTAYTDGTRLEDYMTRKLVDTVRVYNSPFFNFASSGRQLQGEPAARVTVQHSGRYRSRFLYDAEQSRYCMSQFYSPAGVYMDTVDENNGKQLAFDNLMILFTDIHPYPGHEKSDLQYVEYSWGGVGFYCHGGTAERIRWEKGTDLQALRLCSEATGELLEVNPGTSYVAVVDVDEAEHFVLEAAQQFAPDRPESLPEETEFEGER